MTLDCLQLTESPAGVEFQIKVVPGASRDRVAGVLGTALKIAVSAPPEAGKANAAIIELLAARLAVRRKDVEIVSGHTQARKRIRVAGVSAVEVRQRLRQSDG
ncbi:hypothetical protein RAS1_40680 [Phycisphaerae bacterium RAS1]|nr:hypothetical protein RAS1_40680 [Phycisphaerae bacterium RAS1]